MTEVVAALIWDNDKFMICQRPAHKARGLLWEFVGGKVEPGETKEQALIRECKEELGLDIDFDDRPYMRVYFPNGFDDYFMTDCDVDLDKVKMQAEEVLEVKWATKEEIIQMQKDKTFVNYNAGFIDFLFAQRKNRGTYLK